MLIKLVMNYIMSNLSAFDMADLMPDWMEAVAKDAYYTLLLQEPPSQTLIVLCAGLLLVFSIILLVSWKVGKKVKEKIPERIKSRIKSAKEFVVPPEGPRFRKRDKIAFIGQRMVKRVKAAGSYIRGGQGRKRKAIAKFAKRLLGQQISPETGQKHRLALPLEYLEEEFDGGHEVLPQQLKFVLQNMRVFGHFEQPIFLEIVKHIEYMSVPSNQYLFQVGQIYFMLYSS